MPNESGQALAPSDSDLFTSDGGNCGTEAISTLKKKSLLSSARLLTPSKPGQTVTIDSQPQLSPTPPLGKTKSLISVKSSRTLHADSTGSEIEEDDDEWDDLEMAVNQYRANLIRVPSAVPSHLKQMLRRETTSENGAATPTEAAAGTSGRFMFQNRGVSQPGFSSMQPQVAAAATATGGATTSSVLESGCGGPSTPERTNSGSAPNSPPVVNRRTSHSGGVGLMPSLAAQLNASSVEHLEVGRGRVMVRQSMSGSGNYVALSVRGMLNSKSGALPSYARPTTSSSLAQGFSIDGTRGALDATSPSIMQNASAKRTSGRLLSAAPISSGVGRAPRGTLDGGALFMKEVDGPALTLVPSPPLGGARTSRTPSRPALASQQPVTVQPSPQGVASQAAASASGMAVQRPFRGQPAAPPASGVRYDVPNSPFEQPSPASPVQPAKNPVVRTASDSASTVVDQGAPPSPSPRTPAASRSPSRPLTACKSSTDVTTPDRKPMLSMCGALTATPPSVPRPPVPQRTISNGSLLAKLLDDDSHSSDSGSDAEHEE